MLGWVDPGVELEELGTERGWHQVRTPDGKVGFVWNEHVAAANTPSTVTTVVTTTPPTTAPPPRADVTPPPTPTLPTPPQPSGDELQPLRDEMRRLAERQEQFAQRLDRLQTTTDRIATLLEGGTPPPATLPVVPGTAPGRTDMSPGAALVFLVLGGAVGLGIGRFLQHSRDRRQRLKVKL